MAIDSAFVGVGFQPWGVSVCVCAAGDATLMCGQVSDRLPIYEEDLYRVVHLQVLPDSSRQFTLEGIKMNVHIPSRTLLLPHSPPFTTPQLYTISSDDFSAHLKVANYRVGFLNGSAYQHAPIFWSRLFFCNTPAENNRSWSSRVVILNAPENLEGETCEVRIGVEPYTGQIMSDYSSWRHSFAFV